MPPREIQIIGGGLAGLSLGLALQRRGVDTILHEAGTYPRHRVCGEFIAGLNESTIRALGLSELLADARLHTGVQWFRRGERIREQRLNRPARALSRHTLDTRLAEAYVAARGRLRTGSRIDVSTTGDGLVLAPGRRRTRSDWLGLKVHAVGLTLRSDLEFHLGDNGYVGLAGVENERVNVCGLFRRRSDLDVNRTSALLAYLEAAGLSDLAARLRSAELDDASFSAVAGLAFGPTSEAVGEGAHLQIGDAYAMIPPFTGHGMALAFQSAETVLEPLVVFAEGQASWRETVEAAQAALRRRFHRRLALAARLHPFIVSPTPQRLFDFVNRTRLLPLGALAEALHAD